MGLLFVVCNQINLERKDRRLAPEKALPLGDVGATLLAAGCD